MKKHQFVKNDCNCARRATYFVCRHCGVVEFGASAEMRDLEAGRAVCTGEGAPEATPAENFKGKMGGGFDCLDPAYETWMRDNGPLPFQNG